MHLPLCTIKEHDRAEVTSVANQPCLQTTRKEVQIAMRTILVTQLKTLAQVCGVLAQAEAAKQAFSQEVYKARKLPHGQKPRQEQWQTGQFAARLQALHAFALDLAQPSQLSLALESLQVGLKHLSLGLCTPDVSFAGTSWVKQLHS